MHGYLRRIQGFGPDIKLFLVYNLLANIGFGVIELIFNLYLLKLGYKEDFIGDWRAVLTICMAASAALIGTILNRFGVWRGIVMGFSLLIASSLALAFAESSHVLLILGGCYGVALAFLFSPLMPFILEWAPADQRGYAAAVSFSVVSLSTTLGSLIGGFAPSIFSSLLSGIGGESVQAYRWTLASGTIIASLGLIPMFMMGEARRSRPRRDIHVSTVVESVAQKRQTRSDMWIFIMAGGVMSIGVGMVQPFYNVYLKTLGASDHAVGNIYAIGGAVAAVLGLTAPYMTNRLGALRAVVVLRLVIVPFYLPLIFMPSIGIAVAAFIVRQISINMAWPIDSTFIGEVLPPRARAGIYGMRSTAWNIGIAAASFVGGRIIVQSGYHWTFVGIIVSTAIAALMFYGYFQRHPRVLSGAIPSALPHRTPRAEPTARPVS